VTSQSFKSHEFFSSFFVSFGNQHRSINDAGLIEHPAWCMALGEGLSFFVSFGNQHRSINDAGLIEFPAWYMALAEGLVEIETFPSSSM
jgi:hypothetical protein